MSGTELQPLNKPKEHDEEAAEEVEEVAPVDQGNLVFFIILLHGIGTLMPWNMLITISYDVSGFSVFLNEKLVVSVLRILQNAGQLDD